MKPCHRPPPRAGTFALRLFLASLSVLFAATILGYAIIRTRTPASMRLPPLLWLSTALILTASFTIQRALQSIRLEKQTQARNYLLLTLLLAVLFVCFQTPALLQLLHQHHTSSEQGLRLYGLVFFLILLHALHVAGGIVYLVLVIRVAIHRRYDHEHHGPISHAAAYWHFLDVVWIVMFFTLFFA